MIFRQSELKSRFPTIPPMTQLNYIENRQSSLRGFHGALEKANHWKLVTCISGAVTDAVLDIRPNSQTFGMIGMLQITANKPELLVIPPGFAHAFQALETKTIAIYATNIEYPNQDEIDINPLIPSCKEIWGKSPIVSARDENALRFDELLAAGKFYA
ncbi:dTDP-4-dehydrorhamnose 3,5-epimerase [Candidatus Planktophila sulfonica]|uniref:dTDP-4-dehydrorhamnose 3,5-epimerase n=2 Tax=Candidatus Planktophila sulfonica TaxID=1884904 RepID=A0A249KF91_9ACTN|nr:dTDP-4-dehydrorhamnose 3,5-epimerase [Candidatus Planktophila sulfonica]